MNIQEYRAAVRTSKRAAILDSALRIFTERSFASASMADIARLADVSTATLYKHFGSKDELFSHIAAEHIQPFHTAAEEMLPQVQVSQEPVQALIDLSRSFAQLLGNAQTLSLFRLIIAEGDRFPELKEVIYRHGRDPFKARLTQVLQAFADRGLIEIADPAAAAEFYIGMLSYWLLFSPIFNTDIEFSPEQIDHIIRESALMFLARFDAEPGDLVTKGEAPSSLRLGAKRSSLTPQVDTLAR